MLIIFYVSFDFKKPQTPGPNTIAFSPRHGKQTETHVAFHFFHYKTRKKQQGNTQPMLF